MAQNEDPRIVKQPRLNYFQAAPDAMKAMMKLSGFFITSAIEPSLQELVKIRASQINGCGFCLHMHTRDARAHGESEDRMQLLHTWRESPLYTPRERAALAWTEALTLVAERHVSDAECEALEEEFTDQEQVELTLLITVINGWNRFNAAFRTVHPAEQAVAA